MAGPFAPSGRRVAARRRTPGVLGPRARPRPRCGLGLGAALRAGRKRPGPRPSPPHTPPARLGAADGKARGCQPCGLVGAPVRALWARPSRPQRPAGRYPCPPWAAWAPPAPPACGGRGYVAAGRRLRRLRSAPLRGLPAASRCAGVPLRKARPSPFRGAPAARPCFAPPPRRSRRRCSGPPRPHSWGLLGRCGPPARACLAPASRPALARLRLCPRWCGSACARPSRRSGPAPLAASRRLAAGRRPRPLGASRARPQFRRRAQGPCPLCGSRPYSAPRAAVARGCAACGRVCHVADHPTRPRQAACGGPCLMICAVAQCNQGRCIAPK